MQLWESWRWSCLLHGALPISQRSHTSLRFSSWCLTTLKHPSSPCQPHYLVWNEMTSRQYSITAKQDHTAKKNSKDTAILQSCHTTMTYCSQDWNFKDPSSSRWTLWLPVLRFLKSISSWQLRWTFLCSLADNYSKAWIHLGCQDSVEVWIIIQLFRAMIQDYRYCFIFHESDLLHLHTLWSYQDAFGKNISWIIWASLMEPCRIIVSTQIKLRSKWALCCAPKSVLQSAAYAHLTDAV